MFDKFQVMLKEVFDMEGNRMPQQAFHGDQKLPMNSLLGSLERKLIQATVQKIPRWIEGYHLTLMTVGWKGRKEFLTGFTG
jgi:hypothetical protein